MLKDFIIMPIPTYDQIMLPLLYFLGDEKDHTSQDSVLFVIKEFKLSSEESEQKVSNGTSLVSNRASWARFFLKKAGLIEPTARGHFIISEMGKEALRENSTLSTNCSKSSFNQIKKRAP